MLDLVLYGLLAVIVAGGLFLLAARFLPAGEQIAPPLRDEPLWELPAERSLRADDVDQVRLPVALRGYRFAETDILLERLARELQARDTEIAQLRGYDDQPAGAAVLDAEGEPGATVATGVEAVHDAEPVPATDTGADGPFDEGPVPDDRRFAPPAAGDEQR